jgi:hypothetical protein
MHWDVAFPCLVGVVGCADSDAIARVVDASYTMLFSELMDIEHPTMSLGVLLPESCCLCYKLLERRLNIRVFLA